MKKKYGFGAMHAWNLFLKQGFHALLKLLCHWFSEAAVGHIILYLQVLKQAEISCF